MGDVTVVCQASHCANPWFDSGQYTARQQHLASCSHTCAVVTKQYNYLRQGVYVFAGFCFSVCLSVSKITQKIMDGSF